MELTNRLSGERMEYYRAVYGGSKHWQPPQPLEGKRLIVYCEQGLGDTIQFARWFPLLKARGCELYLHCPATIMTVMARTGWVDGVIDKAVTELPPHDLHCLSFDLPFLLADYSPKVEYPYIRTDTGVEFEGDKFVIAVAWEGTPAHRRNLIRSCPLKELAPLAALPDAQLVSLHPRRMTPELSEGAGFEVAEEVVPSVEVAMAVIQAAHAVVCVDTLALHLAGAMGRKAYGLIDHEGDARWDVQRWYPSLTLVRQATPGDWGGVVRTVAALVKGDVATYGDGRYAPPRP
jgi:hypothetical protein